MSNLNANEALIEGFEHAWEDGEPEISEFLPEESSADFLDTLIELVIIDLEFRWKNFAGSNQDSTNSVTVESYINRYPLLDTGVCKKQLVEEEFTIRRKYGDDPALELFAERFPEFAEELQRLDVETPQGTSRQNAMPKRAPVLIDQYTLVGEIGEGGMGSVYLAQQDQPVRRKVAIKVIRRGLDSKDVLARFQAERQALAMMDHQNIARIYDAGVTNQGQPFFAMEFVDGIPITDYCLQQRLSIPDRLRIFNDVCAAVQHAHQKGILHRDLKPSNVLIARDSDKPIAKVIDFGLAKAIDSDRLLTDKSLYTQAGQVLGTLKYMSPEQASTHEQDVDTRADVYALGVMLYELLTGETPLDESAIKRQGVLSVLEMIRDLEPQRPSTKLDSNSDMSDKASKERGTNSSALRQVLRGDLDWVVMKALENDRERRYKSANSLADDVLRFLNDEPVLARPPSVSYRLKKFSKKNRVLVSSAVTILLLLMSGIALTSWLAIRATNAEFEANKQSGVAVAKAAEAEERRLDAEVARDDAKRAAKRAEDALQLLVGSFQATNPMEGGKAGMSATDVLNVALTGLNEQTGIDAASKTTLLTAIAESFRGLGDLDKAKSTAELAVKVCRDHPSADNHMLVAAMTSQAIVHAYANQIDEAIRIEQEVLQILEQTESGEQLGIDIAKTKHYIGLFIAIAGKPDEGLKLLEPSLTYLQNELGSEDYWTLTAMTSMAQVYVAAGYSDKALPLLEEAFVGSEKASGPNHPQTLRIMDNLATCHRSLGNHNRAIEIHENTFRRCHKVLQPHHHTTLAYQEQLGTTYEAAGHLLKAIQTLTPLAAHYHQQFEFANAIRVLEQLVSIHLKQLNDPALKPGSSNSPLDFLNRSEELARLKALWFSQSKLSACYEGINMWDKSVELLRAALDGRSRYLGDKAPDSQGTRLGLARALCAAQQPREAAKVLEAYIKFGDPKGDFNLLRSSYQQLVTISLWINDSDAALRWLDEYKSIKPFDFGDQGSRRTRALSASALAAAGRFEEAAAECNALPHLPVGMPFDDFRCASILARSAANQTATDNLASQAIGAFQAMKSEQAKIAHSDIWCIVRACERVIEIYDIAKSTDKAEAWRLRLADLKQELEFKDVSPEPRRNTSEKEQTLKAD